MNAEALFREVDSHLLFDAEPSRYLRGIGKHPEFQCYPFTMLFKLRSAEQSPAHHPEGNAWNHTLLVVDEAAKRKSESRDTAVFMWAALLHDIGKPLTTRIRNGRITAYDHDRVGEKLAGDFLAELTTNHEFIEKVAKLVRFHMHVLYVVKGLPFADIEAMKMHTDIREVALLGLCDRLGRTGTRQMQEEEQVIRLFLEQCDNHHERRQRSMAKAGMRRPDPKEPHGTESNRKTHFPKNDASPVPELQGSAKFRKEKANPIVQDSDSRSLEQ